MNNSPDAGDSNHALFKVIVGFYAVRRVQHGLEEALLLTQMLLADAT